MKKPIINKVNLNTTENYNCTITNINSLNDFYVQLDKNMDEILANQETIQNLMENLSSKLKKSVRFELNDYVIAKYSLDGIWYRGLITDVSNNGEYQVYFVDYGNFEPVTS